MRAMQAYFGSVVGAAVVSIIAVAGCSSSPSAIPSTRLAIIYPVASEEIRPDLAQVFEARQAVGAFILYDRNAHHVIRYNPDRCAERFIPASTFKIFNSLVSLETGVIADENTVLKWDGVQHPIGEWNRDQDMRTAFRNSTVWFYQQLARRTGQSPMREWLVRENYGNADTGGGIDTFWLSGKLRISADEQVRFLDRLSRREMSFSRRSMDIVSDIMVARKTDQYVLRQKTGWAKRPGQSDLGWLVGYVEVRGNIYCFAMNLEPRGQRFEMAWRQEMVEEILHQLRVLP